MTVYTKSDDEERHLLIWLWKYMESMKREDMLLYYVLLLNNVMTQHCMLP